MESNLNTLTQHLPLEINYFWLDYKFEQLELRILACNLQARDKLEELLNSHYKIKHSIPADTKIWFHAPEFMGVDTELDFNANQIHLSIDQMDSLPIILENILIEKYQLKSARKRKELLKKIIC